MLVLRGLWPALKQGAEPIARCSWSSSPRCPIGLLFGAGLLYGQHTHISIMEYWRWWVVHLWVEGVFEVFATAIVSALFVRMGLVRVSVATTSVLVATIIFLGGGVLGTFHHLYFSGTPIGVIALGSVFSALEVVPLMVVGFEAYSRAQARGHLRLAEALSLAVRVLRSRAGVESHRRGAVRLPHQSAARALLHAGPQHDGHPWPRRAVRRLRHARHRPDAVLHARAHRPGALEQPAAGGQFWCLNIGLAMMVFLSLLPQGLWQTYAELHARLCLRAQRRGHPRPGHAGAGLGKGSGGPGLRGWGLCLRRVHGEGFLPAARCSLADNPASATDGFWRAPPSNGRGAKLVRHPSWQ